MRLGNHAALLALQNAAGVNVKANAVPAGATQQPVDGNPAIGGHGIRVLLQGKLQF
jgi:hypothetical protein